MNFARDLEKKLTAQEWALCCRYVEKAQQYYDMDHWSQARESLMDAIAICTVEGERNAAAKIQYYLRFC